MDCKKFRCVGEEAHSFDCYRAQLAALITERDELRAEFQRLQSAYEVLKTECAEFYAEKENWGQLYNEVPQSSWIEIDDVEQGTKRLIDGNEYPYKWGGKRARLALKKAELIRSGG